MTSSNSFDVVTVGGGLGASALAIAMAKSGARVLVLEKETRFRDRVRGEAAAPWVCGGGAGTGNRGCARKDMRNGSSFYGNGIGPTESRGDNTAERAVSDLLPSGDAGGTAGRGGASGGGSPAWSDGGSRGAALQDQRQ